MKSAALVAALSAELFASVHDVGVSVPVPFLGRSEIAHVPFPVPSADSTVNIASYRAPSVELL
jgi:hypothetical protein